MEAVQRNGSFFETTTLGPPISESPAESYVPLYNNLEPLFAETTVPYTPFEENPFDQTLESAFSRLNVSNIQMNQEELLGYRGLVGVGGGNIGDGSCYGFGLDGGVALPRRRTITGQERSNILAAVEGLNMDFDGERRVGPDIDSWNTFMSSSYQPSNLNGKGYFQDSRRTELAYEFSILPSSSYQNGFWAGGGGGGGGDSGVGGSGGSGDGFDGGAAAAGCSRASCSNNYNVMRSSFNSHNNHNNNGNGYFQDSRRTELAYEFSILPSSSYQNGFWAGGGGGGCGGCGSGDGFDGGAAAAGCSRASCSNNYNVMRSSFNSHNNHNNYLANNSSRRPYWLQEPLNFLSLADTRGRFLSFAKDQYGCRFLQRAIEEATKEEIDWVFMEIIDHVCELMVDPFANYVVQKILEVCSEKEKIQILLMVVRDGRRLVNICLNVHGTRAVQKLLEKLTTKQQISLAMSALSPAAVALTNDMNGHQVIRCCLKKFSDEDNKYLLNEVANNCYQIATDKSGCCAMQQCVDHSKGEARAHLVGQIIANALLLAENQYGNYVVQHVLGLKDPQITESLLRHLKGHFAALSCNRYGSNVVEKCLVESGEQQSTRVVMELLKSPNMSKLLVDPFGNYVIQSVLSVSKGVVLRALLDLVDLNYPMMRSNVYGKWVLAWINKRKPPHM